MPSEPTTVAIVAAVAENGVIGRDNGLPWRLPSDLKRFRTLTMGGTLVMGRLTYQSIGRPLPGRRTIVVTRAGVEGLVTAPSVADAVRSAVGRVFVVGGAGVYREGLALAERLHITRVHARPDGDTSFPSFCGFERVSVVTGTRHARDEHDFTFETWVRRGPAA